MSYDALVIAAHPDDAETQMGGTLAKLSEKGQRILLVSERLFLKGYPFKRYAPRPDGPVTTAITPLRKPRAECTVLLEGQCCNGIVSGC